MEGFLNPRGYAALYESTDHPALAGAKPAMKLSTEDIPHEVKHVADSVGQAGGLAMLQGGAVRDLVRKHFGHSKKAPKDYDVEVHGMEPEHLTNHLKTLGKTKVVGEKSFGVNKLKLGGHEFDISIPAHASFEQGVHGKVDKNMSVEDAGRRRDFTMNNLAMHPKTGDVIDPSGGIHDIKHKILRHASPTTFEEANGNGPIRIMRGAQFAARQGLTPHPETLSLMKKSVHRLASKEVAPERIHGEWKKLIHKGEEPSRGLDILKQSGALKHLHPELHHMDDAHWEHTKRAMDHAHAATRDHEDKAAIRYATLLHKSHGHPDAHKDAHDYMRAHFGTNKHAAAKAQKILEHLHKVDELHQNRDKVTGAHIRRLAHSLGSANIDQLAHVAHAVHKAGSDEPHHAGEWLRAKAREHGVHGGPEKPILTGKHLKNIGVRPGPHMGKIISQVHDLQIDGHVRNEGDAVHHATRIAREMGALNESVSFFARVFTA